MKPPAEAGTNALQPRAKRVGHKGAHHLAHGNTLESFDAALAHGVDMIEFDILPEHVDGTGTLLLGHDYDDLACRVPATLEDGLLHFSGGAFNGIEFDVDMKLAGYEQAVIDALRRHGLAERALISTMEPESLMRVREIAPEITLGWSFPRVRRDYSQHPVYRWPAYALIAAYRLALPGMAADALKAGRVDALMCHWAFVTKRLARTVAQAGGDLYVWTVDDADRIARLEALGVAGIITNDPRLFADVGEAPDGAR